MMGSNSQSTSKGSHNSNISANLQHNLLLQQGLTNSQLGNEMLSSVGNLCVSIIKIEIICVLGQMPQGYSAAGSHNLHNVPPLHHYDMDAYQNL